MSERDTAALICAFLGILVAIPFSIAAIILGKPGSGARTLGWISLTVWWIAFALIIAVYVRVRIGPYLYE